MRYFLDRLYAASALLAVIGIFLVGALTLAQIIARLTSTFVPSAGDFAGFSMGASAFLGLAYTLRQDGHIRVRLVIERLPPDRRRYVEIASLFIGTAMIGYFAYYTCWLLYQTYIFGEYTLGIITIPKWIPMIAMPVGVVILFIAFVEDLVSVLRGGDPSYEKRAELESDIPTELM